MVITTSIVVIVVFVLRSHRQQLSATAKTRQVGIICILFYETIIFNIAFSDTEQVIFPVSTDIPLEDFKDENNE